MHKIFTRFFLLVIFLSCAVYASGQTITIGAVDPGPYGQGSTIMAPVHVDDTGAGSCINPNNTYTLYLSDASGNFTSEQPIGSFTGMYTSFLNGSIPAGTPAGTGYKLRVKSSNPVAVSQASATFEIGAATGIFAGISGAFIDPAYPEVFGLCNGVENKTFNFAPAASAGALTTVSFYNELTGSSEGSITLTAAGGSFQAKSANYTLLVKSTTGGIVATKGYLLINNQIYSSFGTIGNGIVCLQDGGGVLTFSVDVTSPNGLKSNFPGNTYDIDWGDGSNSILTFCDIRNSGGLISHTYTSTSCGQSTPGHPNAFQVSIQPKSPYCGTVGTQVISYSKVVSAPINSFSNPQFACTSGPVTFRNTSFPGQDPNSTVECTNANALYTWYVDGTAQAFNVPLSTDFQYTFTSPGVHRVRLELQDNGLTCSASPVEQTICVQDPQQPKFSLPQTLICTGTPLTPADESVVHTDCGNTNTYLWTVSGPAAVAYAGGTNKNSTEPQFLFNTPGIYHIKLGITSASCGLIETETQEVVVNTTPVAMLSADANVCGNNRTYEFSAVNGITKTTLTGTSQALAGTYSWTVSGGDYEFTAGTTPNSRYPSILFKDYAVYTISVIHTNNCGTTSDSQQLSFKPAPTVNAGMDQSICRDGTASLDGSISDMATVTAYHWKNGAGTFTPSRDDLHAVYTPSAGEINAGQVTLTLEVTTNLPAPCNVIPDNITIFIKPLNVITSPAATVVCTGTPLDYQLTSSIPGSTFTWSAALTSGTASGFASGNGTSINDVITNTDLTGSTNAVVTYTIIPANDGCSGTPFTFKVTVSPKPVLTPTAILTICDNQAAGINLASTVPNTRYTWSSSVSGSLTGASNQPGPVAVTKINDMLVNRGTTPATVTYTITPYSSSGCPGNPETITITVLPSPLLAKAGPDENLCNETSYNLQGNDPQGLPGKWTLQSGQTGISFADASKYNTTVSGLQGGQTYVFRWTISNPAPCGDNYDEVTIKDFAPVVSAISLTNSVVCAGQNVTITGDTPTGGSGSYTYSWESSPDNITWTSLPGQKDPDLVITISETGYYRRIVSSVPCTGYSSNSVLINVQPPIESNTLSAAVQEICINNSPGIISGSNPTGGDGTYSYRWQISTDGSTWNDIDEATTKDYQVPALTESTRYRRIVSSNLCTGPQSNISNVISITVYQNAKAGFTFTSDAGCAPFLINSQLIKATDLPDRNQDYTWYADNVLIGTGLAFPGYTIATEGKSVVIKLVVSSSHGCLPDEYSHTFRTTRLVTAGLSADKTQGCGPLIVSFNNLSAPLNDARYLWDFGNGQTSAEINPGSVDFQAQDNGRDTTYTVTLTAKTDCEISTSQLTVTVRPQPKIIVYPVQTSGCSPFVLTMNNKSPGAGNRYIYDWGDGSAPETYTDTRDVLHQYTVTVKTSFTVKVRIQNECGFMDSPPYIITVSPNTVVASLTVNGNEKRGCAPFTTHFYNNSTGASLFTYDFNDGTPVASTLTSPEMLEHTFTRAGTYTVTLTASNGCSSVITTQTIIVDPIPVPGFTADVTSGCTQLTVKFTNQTADNNITAYIWDFGDGSYYTGSNPAPHTYSYEGSPYTVRLTATNGLGCSNTTVMSNYIDVERPPLADFSIRPDSVISIPDYRFSFADQTAGQVETRIWDFGDGTSSREINPSHTYPDTGRYEVRLTITNAKGCTTTKTKQVRVDGVPGQLYIPNAFMPSSLTAELKTFKAKGSGIKEWHMRIFNNWGQLIWETSGLSAKGEPVDAWDGTFKGSPVPQGVYIWEVSAQFINGTGWKGMSYNNSIPKRTGYIHLIR